MFQVLKVLLLTKKFKIQLTDHLVSSCFTLAFTSADTIFRTLLSITSKNDFFTDFSFFNGSTVLQTPPTS